MDVLGRFAAFGQPPDVTPSLLVKRLAEANALLRQSHQSCHVVTPASSQKAASAGILFRSLHGIQRPIIFIELGVGRRIYSK